MKLSLLTIKAAFFVLHELHLIIFITVKWTCFSLKKNAKPLNQNAGVAMDGQRQCYLYDGQLNISIGKFVTF